jgi:hypothetical protein
VRVAVAGQGEAIMSEDKIDLVVTVNENPSHPIVSERDRFVEMVQELEAKVEALEKDRTWQPIATAPEATYVMVSLPNAGLKVATMTRDGAVGCWWDGEERIYPSHWMPLPPSPGWARP